MKSSALKTDISSRLNTRGSISRNILFRVFENISSGMLIIEEGEEQFSFGHQNTHSGPIARVKVNNPLTYNWMLSKGDLGAGEAFMLGYWQTPDLLGVIQLFARNSAVLSGINEKQTLLSKLTGYFLHLLNRNSISGSRKNIAAHYDLSNDFFSLFLDPSMAYSSAIFSGNELDLHTASINKFKHICERLQLNEQDHLVEIGTGWGGLAIFAAQHYGCKVTTTTISEQQFQYASNKVKSLGLDNQVTVVQKDYRELQGKYSKLVSIEMIEAVGPQYYQAFFNRCNELLEANGLMLIQAITISDQRYLGSTRKTDFIKSYIFPGGQLPSNQVITSHLCDDTDMQLIGLEDITYDYALTLAKWRDNFLAKLDQVRQLGYDQKFINMWLYYLCFCEAGFRERLIHTAQFLCAKPQFNSLPQVQVNNA